MNVWQVASGDAGRNYADLFLKHDIMCIGPGWFGPYEKDRYNKVIDAGYYSKHKIGCVRQFHSVLQPGDVVLLRKGLSVVGLGLASGDYHHDERFDDIHGWNLQHTRRVLWQGHLADELRRLQKEDNLFSHLKQMPTFSRVTEKSGQVIDQITPLARKAKERKLADLPPIPPPPLTQDELGERLFSKGIANDAVDRVLPCGGRHRAFRFPAQFATAPGGAYPPRGLYPCR
jgi:hypothetical protein